MKRVLVDVDGVLADFHRHTLDFVLAQFGRYFDPDVFPTWDMFETIGRDIQPEVEAHWAQPGWCNTIPVCAGAPEGIEALRGVAEVYFVTAQMTHSPYWMWERVQWLKRHFGADDRHVVFTLSKHLVVGDVLVDDKPANVIGWAAAHPQGLPVLWNHPANAFHTHLEREIRCGNWQELLGLVVQKGGLSV